MRFRPGEKFKFDIGPMPAFVKPYHHTQILGADHFMVGRWCMGSNAEGHSHPGLNHHLIAICLAERGARFELETDRRYIGQLRFGDMSVLPAHVPSHNRWSGVSNTLSLHMPIPLWEEIADAHHIPPSLLHPGLPGSDPAISRLSVMLAEELERPYHNLMYCESLALGAFAKMAERLGGHAIAHCDALVDWRLRRVTDYIEANLENGLNIADLASIAGLSRSHFMQAFRDAFSQTPHQYVLARRIDNARRRLRMEEENITDIANSLGFSSHAHFSVVFRRMTGVSPKAYRQGTDAQKNLD